MDSARRVSDMRKKKSKSNHQRRRYIGVMMAFDGIEENGQTCIFTNGHQLTERDIDQLIKFEFRWLIEIRFIYKNELGFVRTAIEEFRINTPCRFNSLKEYANELGTKAGLSMPDGYKFDLNTWKARVIG